MKYYLYRSLPKIDMLWEQLDAKTVEKYSAELKVSIGLVTGGVKSQPTDKNLHARLDVVLRDLSKKGVLGSVETPSVFFQGAMPMTWNEINFYRGRSDKQMVLFSGYDKESNILVGLVGSASHVIGMDNLEPATLGYSQPSFWNRVVDELTTPSEEELKSNLYDLDNMIDYQGRRREDGPPKQDLEFVAKTYLSNQRMIIGSPLYVAESLSQC